MSRGCMSEPLGAIRIYTDNRVKMGTVLPTRDGRNYRCSKATLQGLKQAIHKENGQAFARDSLLFAELYRPKVLPITFMGLA